MGFALQAVYKGAGEGTQVAKVARMQIVKEGAFGRKPMARKEAQEQRKVAKVIARDSGLVAKPDTLQLCRALQGTSMYQHFFVSHWDVRWCAHISNVFVKMCQLARRGVSVYLKTVGIKMTNPVSEKQKTVCIARTTARHLSEVHYD